MYRVLSGKRSLSHLSHCITLVKFITLVNRLGIHKTTIMFKINVCKLCERHPKLLKSSIGLGFLKNHYKDIKEICSENAKEFS